ncbi:hypothetical protein BH20ACT3_BH20ACT3_01360 [soil metagenome]
MRSRRDLGGKLLRYAAGSGVATVCSQVTFIVLYGALGAGPAVASVGGWLAGAVPNYWLNRTWTWQRRGRPSMTREVLPYVAIVLATLLLATVATSAVHAGLDSTQVSDRTRLVLVGSTFLGVYGVMFLLRYFMLDRLFRRVPAGSPPGSADPLSTKETV